ncbi:hypothetical protein MVEG_10385 [Podila verticillata NRRL 6337]|nr:hypothetical protein MVEG_10385 [Podila verticillata NRRL 6337]
MNPLQLPELLAHVAEYFGANEADSASRVCRAWNSAFSPVIWELVHINDKALTNEHATQGLVRNASHCRCLIYDDVSYVSQLPVPPCIELTRIVINNTNMSMSPEDTDLTENWDQLTKLVQDNPRLRTVCIAAGPGTPTTTAFWASLTSCTQVRLIGVHLTAEHVRALWEGCKNVQQFSADSTHLIDTTKFYAEAQGTFTHLKQLDYSLVSDVDAVTEAQNFLTKCPNLTQFTMECTRPSSQQALAILTTVLKQGYLPLLEKLTLTFIVSDSELSSCLREMGLIKCLNVQSTSFGSLAFSSLVPHFAALERLQWTHCEFVSGEMIQTVLESCPGLRVLSATKIEAALIQKGRPWVCLRLRTLIVCVVVEGRETQVGQKEEEDRACEQSRAVFRKLGQLTELEVLKIGMAHRQREPTHVQGLDLRLKSGMGQLAGLRKLRVLDHTGTEQNMGVEDFDWMKANFRQCKNRGRW